MSAVEFSAALPESEEAPVLERWRFAYRLAVANAVLFLCLSALCYANDAGLDESAYIAALYCIGSVVAFTFLLRAGLELGAIAYFVLSSGIFFGLGSAMIVWFGDYKFNTLFSDQDQIHLLAKVNLVNAVSITIVLLTAWRLSRPLGRTATGFDGLTQTLALAIPYRGALLIAAIFLSVFLMQVSYPLPDSTVFLTLALFIRTIVLAAILFGAARWSSSTSTDRIIVVALLAMMVFLGLTSLSKGSTVMPLGAFMLGLILDRHSSKLLSVFALATFVSYFLLIGPICNGARLHPATRPENSLSDRTAIILDTASIAQNFVGTADNSDSMAQSVFFLSRLSIGPVEAFLIQQHDGGFPGDSLDQAWAAVIPRVLWPGKPEITRISKDLDALYNNSVRESRLAPSYVGEAYWNWGWLGVVLVSLLVGLQFGWYTREWNRFVASGLERVGILIMSVSVLVTVFSVESSIAAAFIGGFLSTAILITAINIMVRVVFPRLIASPPDPRPA